jgi:hypothetical protein
LKKTAAVGVDGVTWFEYERDLEANLKDLHGRIHRGSYLAKPSRRSWIPKPDGRKRPPGNQDACWKTSIRWESACRGKRDPSPAR